MSRIALLIATLGPVGYWPWGPGTLASAVVAIVWWRSPVDPGVWLVAVALSVLVGVAAAGCAERFLGPDDGRIVIDELAGMGLAVLAVPHTFVGALVALLLFRALDIGKPPPVQQVQAVAGGWGVMLDDLVAGAGAAALALAGRGLLGSYL